MLWRSPVRQILRRQLGKRLRAQTLPPCKQLIFQCFNQIAFCNDPFVWDDKRPFQKAAYKRRIGDTQQLLNEPLMYLSGYLKKHQSEYYSRLSAIRTGGDWESWVVFFLKGVVAASADAEQGIVTIASLVASDRRRLMECSTAGVASYRLFENLPMMPRFTIERVRRLLDTSFPTANAAVKILEELNIVTETTGQKTNRQYSYRSYIEALTS